MNLNLEKLKQQFDRVTLKHIKSEDSQGVPRTIAVLYEGKERFAGISYCHKNDQFNRKRGREIALNRALHRYKTYKGEETPRSPENYTVQALDNSLNSAVFNIESVPQEIKETIPPHLYTNKVNKGA